jgi:hypothetical protein
MAKDPASKIERQIVKAGLPTSGAIPFRPQLGTNSMGEPVIQKVIIQHGPKKGKYGYLDTAGRIWIRDRAHAGYPDHWDVQENGGKAGHTRVDSMGNILP